MLYSRDMRICQAMECLKSFQSCGEAASMCLKLLVLGVLQVRMSVLMTRMTASTLASGSDRKVLLGLPQDSGQVWDTVVRRR